MIVVSLLPSVHFIEKTFSSKFYGILFMTVQLTLASIGSSLTEAKQATSHLPKQMTLDFHDDVTKWKRFPCWPFVRGIHRVDSPHEGLWCGALMFSLIYAWPNAWANNPDASDLRRHRPNYDVIVMKCDIFASPPRVTVWMLAEIVAFTTVVYVVIYIYICI